MQGNAGQKLPLDADQSRVIPTNTQFYCNDHCAGGSDNSALFPSEGSNICS